MPNSNPLGESIEPELNLEGMAALEMESLRRRSETIVELLNCMEKLRRLRCACLSCDRIPRTDGRG